MPKKINGSCLLPDLTYFLYKFFGFLHSKVSEFFSFGLIFLFFFSYFLITSSYKFFPSSQADQMPFICASEASSAFCQNGWHHAAQHYCGFPTFPQTWKLFDDRILLNSSSLTLPTGPSMEHKFHIQIDKWPVTP